MSACRGTQRRVSAALAVCLGLTTSNRAWAVGASLQGQITLSAGVTDNVTNEVNDPPPTSRGRQTDLIVSINPALILTTGAPRAVQQLSYVFGGIVYARNADASTYTNTLRWGGFFIPSKRTTMDLSLAVQQGRQSAFNTSVSSSETAAPVQLSGATNLLTITAGQGLSWELARDWRLLQSLGFSTVYFLDQSPPVASTQAVPGRLAIERRFPRSAIALEGNVIYTNFLEQRGPVTQADGTVDPNGVVQPQQGQVTVTPLATYRRDLSYFLSARAQLGAVVVLDPGDLSSHHVEPAGNVGLNFFHPRANVDINYAHGATPNLQFRSNFISDLVAARATVLFSEKNRIGLNFGASYSYQRQLDLQAQPTATAHTIFVDATLTYTPLRMLGFFVRYQFLDQIGQSGSVGGQLPSYYRNTLLFGLTAVYPTEAVASLPRGTTGQRADGRDDGTIPTSKSTPK